MPSSSSLSGSVDVAIDMEAELPTYVFQGRPRTHVDLQLYGMFQDLSSIPNVSRQLALALTQAVPSLAIHSYIDDKFVGDELEAYRGVDPSAPLCLFYGVPNAVRPPVMAHATCIIGLACETDRIPLAWVEVCNGFDLAFVPSRYCCGSLLRSGVTVPVMVVPHGVEDCYRPTKAKARGERFVFYNVINADRPARKGLLELLRAFDRAFQGRRDVVLRLRTQHSFRVRQVFAQAGIAMDDPRIEIDPRMDLPTERFAAAYSEVHCTVHPSRAEGFGLIPLQSIACETPVIAPASTGMADYLTDANAILLRTRGTTETPDVYYRYGSHPLIDEDHLVELLRHAEANWEQEYAKVRRAAADLRMRYSWQASLHGLRRLTEDLVVLPRAEDRRLYLSEALAASE